MTKNTDSLIVELDTGGTSEIGFRATGVAEYWPSVTLPDSSPKESGWKVSEGETLTEPVFMDTARQKLELDITHEFEVADGEATLLIDKTK